VRVCVCLCVCVYMCVTVHSFVTWLPGTWQVGSHIACNAVQPTRWQTVLSLEHGKGWQEWEVTEWRVFFQNLQFVGGVPFLAQRQHGACTVSINHKISPPSFHSFPSFESPQGQGSDS